VKKLQDKFRTL